MRKIKIIIKNKIKDRKYIELSSYCCGREECFSFSVLLDLEL